MIIKITPQIEEMARTLCGEKEKTCARCDSFGLCEFWIEASIFHDAGYRKQEWISVDERLPERNGRYLTHCNIEGQSLVCILYYCKVGVFNEGTVTHWMPLPEAPKMKNTEN